MDRKVKIVVASVYIGKAEDEFKRALRGMESEGKASGKRLAGYTETASREQSQSHKRYADSFINDLHRMETAERRRSQAAQSYSTVTRGAFSGSFMGNVGAQAVSEVTGLLKEGASAVLNYSANLEQIAIGFERLEGSSSAAKKQLAAIQKFSNETPLTFEGLLPTAQRFEELGYKGEKLLPVLRDIGDLVAGGVGKPGESLDDRLGRVSLAIKQTFDKRGVQMEELNQLSEAGINGLEALSKGLGKTKAEILDMSQKGQISGEMLLVSLQKLAREDFGGAMEKQSRTFNGSLSTIQDSLLTTAATAFEPLFGKISEISVRISKEVSSAADFNKALEKLFTGAGEVVTVGAEHLGKIWVRKFVEIFTDGDLSGFGLIGGPIAKGIVKGVANGIKNAMPDGRSWQQKQSEAMEFYKNNPVEDYGRAVELAFNPASSALYRIANDIKGVNAEADNLPDLNELLKAQKAAAETKKLGDIVRDLAYQIDGYGEKTEVAALKQKMLKEGIEDFNSANAQTALLMAERLDQLKEFEDQAKKFQDLAKYVQDLGFRVSNFGDESEVTAVKTKLLFDGITDFNSGLAQQALAWAARLDQLKQQKKEQDEFNNYLKDTTKQLAKFKSDADFDLKFPEPTKLQEFNRWVKENVKDTSAFKNEIEDVRKALANFDTKRAMTELAETRKSFLSDMQNQIIGMKFEGTDLFTNQLGEIAQKIMQIKGLTRTGIISDQFGIDLFPEDFTDKINGFLNTLDTLDSALDTKGDRSQTFKALRNYLSSIGEIDLVDGNKLPLFDDKSADEFIKKLQKLRLALGNKEGLEIQKAYNDLLSEVTEKTKTAGTASIFYQTQKQLETEQFKKLNEEQKKDLLLKARQADFAGLNKGLQNELDMVLRNGKEYTQFEKTQREITENYSHLSEAEQKNLLTKASQIDAVKKLQEQYSNLRDMLKETLDFAVDGDFKGLLDNFADIAKESFTDRMSDFLAKNILGFDPDEIQNPLLAENKKQTTHLATIVSAITGQHVPGASTTSLPFVGPANIGLSPRNIMGGYGITGTGFGGTIGGFAGGLLNGGVLSTGTNQGVLWGMSPGGMMSAGGGGYGTRTGDVVDGVMQIFAGDKGRNDIWSNIKKNFSWKNLEKTLFGDKGFGWNSGTTSGLGSIAQMIAPLLGGGRLSSVVGMAGQGAQIGSMFGPWGGAIGAGVGALVGLFTGGSRRQDEEARTQAKNAVLTKFDEILSQLKGHQINPPSSAATQADSIKSENKTAMNQLKDSKTKRIALDELKPTEAIGYKRGLIDVAIGAESKYFARKQSAADIYSRILPEFASGNFFGRDDQLRDIANSLDMRRGYINGGQVGVDRHLGLFADGEIIANKRQQQNIINAAGFDVFAHAGIPNYPKKYAEGNYFPPKVLAPSFQPNTAASVVNNTFNISVVSESGNAEEIKQKVKEGVLEALDNREVRKKAQNIIVNGYANGEIPLRRR